MKTSADFSLERIAGDGIVNDSFDYTMKTSDFYKTTNLPRRTSIALEKKI